MGHHELKAGYGLQKHVNNVFDSYVDGAYVMLYWDVPFTFGGRFDRGTYGYYEVNQMGRVGSAASLMHSLYVQDLWRLTPRLSLNLGFRAEQERVPSFRRDVKQYAFDFNLMDKAAPRFGASYDVFGDGRVKAFGSWGRFFDWMKYDLPRNVFGADIWRVHYRSLDTLNVFSLSLNNMPGRDLWFPGPQPTYRERARPIFGRSVVDPGLKPVSQDQISGGVEYQLNDVYVFGARYLHNQLRRAIEDLPVLVDNVESYIYANPGEGMATRLTGTTGRTQPFDYPKPVRKYDAVEFSVNRRMSAGWFGNAAYTWSRLWGNYAGLASSDELRLPTTNTANAITQQFNAGIARSAGYWNNNYDVDEVLWDSRGNLNPVGNLATDRTHVLKLNGGYEFPFGTHIGTFMYLGSGTPLTTQVNTANQYPVFVNGRGDLGRTPFLSYTDLLIGHRLRIGESQSIRVEFNMLNVFNQRTTRHRFTDLNRGAGQPLLSSAMNLSGVDLAQGYDYNTLIRNSLDGPNAFDPRYGKDDLFNPGFSGRFGLKWTF